MNMTLLISLLIFGTADAAGVSSDRDAVPPRRTLIETLESMESNRGEIVDTEVSIDGAHVCDAWKTKEQAKNDFIFFGYIAERVDFTSGEIKSKDKTGKIISKRKLVPGELIKIFKRKGARARIKTSRGETGWIDIMTSGEGTKLSYYQFKPDRCYTKTGIFINQTFPSFTKVKDEMMKRAAEAEAAAAEAEAVAAAAAAKEAAIAAEKEAAAKEAAAKKAAADKEKAERERIDDIIDSWWTMADEELDIIADELDWTKPQTFNDKCFFIEPKHEMIFRNKDSKYIGWIEDWDELKEDKMIARFAGDDDSEYEVVCPTYNGQSLRLVIAENAPMQRTELTEDYM